jgi:hypothetical protein
MPNLRSVRTTLKPRPFLHDGDRDRVLAGAERGPLAEKHQEIAHVSAGDEDLRAVDNDVIAVGAESGLHARRIRAGVRLGERERYECAFGDARQPAFFLLFAAEIDERARAMEIRRPYDARRGARLADLAAAGEVHGIREPRAAVLLGHEHRVQPQLVDVAHVVPGKFFIFVIRRSARCDALSGEPPHAVEHHRFVLGKRESCIQPVQYVHKFLRGK